MQIQHFTYIVAGKSSHLLIRAGTECVLGRLVFRLTYTMMHGNTKFKLQVALVFGYGKASCQQM